MACSASPLHYQLDHKVANFAGVGLFEVNFGKDGFSMRLGMNGIDVSMGTIDNPSGTALSGKNISEIANATITVSQISDDMKKGASILAAAQAQKQVDLMIKQYAERLARENKGMSDWEKTLVRDSGYQYGNVIERNAIIGSTIGGVIRERQTVHKYVDFVAPGATVSVSLDRGNLQGMDDYGIMLLVSQAQRDLSGYGERIFGKQEGLSRKRLSQSTLPSLPPRIPKG
jgi:hypothetical protein